MEYRSKSPTPSTKSFGFSSVINSHLPFPTLSFSFRTTRKETAAPKATTKAAGQTTQPIRTSTLVSSKRRIKTTQLSLNSAAVIMKAGKLRRSRTKSKMLSCNSQSKQKSSIKKSEKKSIAIFFLV